MTTMFHSSHDALAPYRASIRRMMRERKCDPITALAFCCARCGRKHEEMIERLLAAEKQIAERATISCSR